MSAPDIPTVLTQEPLPLDLLNTHMYLDGTWVDLLDDTDQRQAWLELLADRVGITQDEARSGSSAMVESLRSVRGHAAATIEPVRNGDMPPEAALTALNKSLLDAPASLVARWNGSAVVTDVERTGNLAQRVAATFAQATIELLASSDIAKVRRCDAPACVMLFLPRNPKRRWCTPSICGNRVRVARYYIRHKDDESAPR